MVGTAVAVELRGTGVDVDGEALVDGSGVEDGDSVADVLGVAETTGVAVCGASVGVGSSAGSGTLEPGGGGVYSGSGGRSAASAVKLNVLRSPIASMKIGPRSKAISWPSAP